jgi:hypothetical protein
MTLPRPISGSWSLGLPSRSSGRQACRLRRAGCMRPTVPRWQICQEPHGLSGHLRSRSAEDQAREARQKLAQSRRRRFGSCANSMRRPAVSRSDGSPWATWTRSKPMRPASPTRLKGIGLSFPGVALGDTHRGRSAPGEVAAAPLEYVGQVGLWMRQSTHPRHAGPPHSICLTDDGRRVCVS